MIKRTPGWQRRLAVYLGTVARSPFAFGSQDCALFAAGAVEAMTGTDLAASYRGRYTTLRGGLRIMRRDGFADHIAFFGHHLPDRDGPPQPGDLAVVPTDDGPALGVVQGDQIYVTSPGGLALVPLGDAPRFLRV
ncbi:DUF6950 family protein [Pseudogemmobacter sonorensis]|uniref:DUF6950 family protein n=1 Tax=Pseudogemmobacter sonorensis TaxID=2989681 RepID=UPI0036B9F0C3